MSDDTAAGAARKAGAIALALFMAMGALGVCVASCSPRERDQRAPLAGAGTATAAVAAAGMKAGAAAAFADAPFMDASLSADARALDLLSRMSLDEKLGQMTQAARDYLGHESNIAKYGLGSVLSGGGSAPARNTPEGWANMVDGYQAQALSTRLGIPLLYGVDAVHGHNNLYGAVIFPHNIGLGAGADPSTVERAARVSAMETAATGIRWTFAPCLAVPQDERWGRSYEGFSEDGALVAKLGEAAIRGFQGSADYSELGQPAYIMATAKHYLADGATTGGVDQGDAAISEAELRARHLAPYEAAMRAGVGSVMVSFSSWNGLKLHQHSYLINDVLKGELGFKGFVVSDWAGIKHLPGGGAEQIALGINAGIDMVMVPDSWREFLADIRAQVQAGAIAVERIDDAAFRILRAKFLLGLFERPLTDRSLIALVGSGEHREAARKAVRQSVVVLKNGGLLPLPRDGVRIAVVGAAADDLGYQCGGWTISWQGSRGTITQGTTILEALRDELGQGSSIRHVESAAGLTDIDLAVVVAAEEPYAEMKGDDSSLSFPPSSRDDIRALKAQGIAVLTILMSGRPLVINEELKNSDAFVAAWLPGSEAAGISDILFGAYAPTGRLSFTWFDSVQSIPVNATKAGQGVLFPFGYGLSW